ncbi:MAG: DUF2914 domain-containing protein [Deltaproteobacteria bacterium]|nr:DUF2914 domain-containing protein [Deltaproteobacteria bacterium]
MTEPVGKYLKQERERLNIPLEKICSSTKIKEHHLRAIEEEKYELLPHPLYVKGYLKSYARYLTLDEKDILAQYENYLKSLLPPEPPVSMPETPPSKKRLIPLSPTFLIILTFLITSFFVTYLMYDSTEEKPVASLLLPAVPATATQREEGIPPADLVQPVNGVERETKKVDLHPTSGCEILEAGIGTNIEKDNDRQFLTGNALDFNSNNQRGYFFTRIKTPKPGKIAHVWLLEGKEYHRIEMDVKPPAWSVYSYLTFQPQHVGNWKAEVREGEQTLTSLNFKVLQ